MFSASPSQRPDPHHHLAASAHRRARQLRPHDPLRWVPAADGAAPPPRPPPRGRGAPPEFSPLLPALSFSFPAPRALQTCPADGRRGSRRRAPATSSSEYRLPAPRRPPRAGGRWRRGPGPGSARPPPHRPRTSAGFINDPRQRKRHRAALCHRESWLWARRDVGSP